MTIAYVDTSILVATLLDEPGAAVSRHRLDQFDALLSSALLEAEVFAVLVRQGLAPSSLRRGIVELVTPVRPLTSELIRVYGAGYVPGADAWHLATALYLSPDPPALTFLTLDAAQGDVARTLGFVT